jgi:hypothetical protein
VNTSFQFGGALVFAIVAAVKEAEPEAEAA